MNTSGAHIQLKSHWQHKGAVPSTLVFEADGNIICFAGNQVKAADRLEFVLVIRNIDWRFISWYLERNVRALHGNFEAGQVGHSRKDIHQLHHPTSDFAT